MEIRASISVGELVDKITILEIKLNKIKNPEKLQNIKNELDVLNEYFVKIENDQLNQLKNKLKDTNLKLWQIEDDIRVKKTKTSVLVLSTLLDLYILLMMKGLN